MNNDNNIGTYICPRCGSDVKNSSRYCMKCGQVNVNHPDNESFIKATKGNVMGEDYNVGKGGFSKENIIIDANTGNFTICILFNYLLYFISIIFFTIMSLSKIELSLEGILSSNIPIMIVLFSIFFLYFYTVQRLFMKINRKWWEALIPIYNIMVLSDCFFNKKILGLLILVPVIGELYLIILLYQLGRKFQYSGLLTVLLFPIYLFIITYGSHFFQGKAYESSDVSIEKEYKMNKNYLTIVMLFLVIGFGAFIYANIAGVEEGVGKVDNLYYVKIAKKVVKKVKKATDDRHVVCDSIDYRKKGYTYMIYFSNVSDVIHVPFKTLRDEIAAYVLVTFVSDDNIIYEVSLNDGVKMIEKIKVEDLTVDKVVSSNNSFKYDYPYMCNIV